MNEVFLRRLQRMDFLISTKSTGSPQHFASKLEISVSTLYEYIVLMKSRGAPIKYDKYRQTYFYEEPGFFQLNFFRT
jgi:predicted DNA-binding transcriptional regulator YafY